MTHHDEAKTIEGERLPTQTEGRDQGQSASLLDALGALKLARLSLSYRAEGDGPLPADLGNLLRGTFGAALKRVSGDLVGEASPYEVLFESPVPEDAPVLRNASHMPHPFVLRPPLTNIPDLRPGSQLSFELLLIGERAIALYPQVLLALLDLGRHGLGQRRVPLSLSSVEELGNRKTRRPLLDARGVLSTPRGESLVSRDAEQRPGTMPRDDVVDVAFLTPAQIVVDGGVRRDLSFQGLVRALLRRTSSLCAYYGAGPLDLDFGAILHAAARVVTVENHLEKLRHTRYSARQKRRTPQTGLWGQVRYRGAAVEALWPLLHAGEQIHVGKGTSFGLGRMRASHL